MGYIVAGLAIAAGGGVDKLALLIEKRNCHTVDLWFYSNDDVLMLKVFLQTAVEVDEFLLGTTCCGLLDTLGAEFEDVVDAEHGEGMLDLLETSDGCATDAMGDRVRVTMFWMFCF